MQESSSSLLKMNLKLMCRTDAYTHCSCLFKFINLQVNLADKAKPVRHGTKWMTNFISLDSHLKSQWGVPPVLSVTD